ncbi:penicillin-binding protein 2 [Campylobacter sp. 19-13652]|uniref:penicillin-binding protein 2 n=1 Tax=Campylobacter sp. 19-13652 TaxID=2840180 RepID=UPI001C77D2C5|nr:penicillin-binding protein 2 [Campylobacter sp. 19-13652]BCX79074.1 penicillin-binding protein [Campylobacter sp. 19-13652]
MRLKIVFSIIVLFWIVLLTRIYHLSVKSNTYYEGIAEQNAAKTQLTAPVRGEIYDIKNRPVAINNLGFAISIKPHLSSKEDRLDGEIEFIVSLFPDLNAQKIKREYKKADSPYNQDFIKVVEFIDYDRFMPHYTSISLHELLRIDPASKRQYPYSSIASHIIGYVGRANQKDIEQDEMTRLSGYVGRTGIEAYYNSVLQGQKGTRVVRVNALNEEIEQLSITPPRSEDIRLSIDMQLQKYIAEVFGKEAGSVVVLSLKDGSILAAGSFPEYDLNQFVSGISKAQWEEMINDVDHPFTNKLVNGLYPPGSVVKMGVGLSFLDSGKLTRHDTFNCTGSYELGDRKFRCWNSHGHGIMNLNSAIRESCDDYFYKGSQKVGIDIIAQTLERIGFGVRSGVDLPNEFVGTVPSREWKQRRYNKPWFVGETLITSIGQGSFLVTPMQVAKYTAQLATGKVVVPHFIDSIDGKKLKYELEDGIYTEFEKSQLPYIRHAMYEVVNHEKGTARHYFHDLPFKVAAKTGTAQVVGISQSEKIRMKEEDMKYLQRSHAWLTTYAPYDDPQYVITMIIEHGGHGGSAAGPKISAIYKKLIELGYIKF